METKQWKKAGIIISFLALAAVALSGCSGSDGAAGATGATGPAGPAGPAGPVTLTNESCLVCHNTNDVANIMQVHNFVFDAATGSRTKPRLNELNLKVTITQVAANAANQPVITFNVKDGANANYNGVAASALRVVIADLIPKNTATVNYGTWGSDYFENWVYETGSATNTLGLTNDGAGNYTITIPVAFGAKSTSNANNDDYRDANIKRVYVRVSSTIPGTGGDAAVYDIQQAPGASNVAVKVDTQKQFVTIEACRKCHGRQMNGAAHASGYVDTLGCALCHSPLSGRGEEVREAYLPLLIHKIHAALDVEAFPTRILGRGYEDVTYPQPISDCVVCHTASGRDLGAGNQIDNWKNNPTIEICGTCHVSVNFATGAGHVGGAYTTSVACSLCHSATSITAYHSPAAPAKDVPEYAATISITPPANTTHYVVGETPTVTVTLTAGGVAVPGTLYTAAKHAAGTFNAGSLSKAVLYVYGPRANAMPRFTKGAETFNATTGAPTQANSLLLPSTDAQVLTDATGFKYKLKAIPAGTTNGTYMIRFVAQNYGRISDTDYQLDTTAFKTIQVGTASVEQRISGDKCTDCHGNRLFGPHNARHSVAFSANSTDECISCHDKSGNHAQALDLRVHAIHSASATGDWVHGAAAPKDWSEITYPQGIPTVAGRNATTGLLAVGGSTGAPRCITCHTGTAGTGILYRTTSVSERTCKGCHADKRGAMDHFLQMGGR